MTAQLSLFTSNERTDAWSVRTSRRAKRLSVRVYPGGRVEIVAPQGASPLIVQRFIGQHRQWIDDRVQAFAGQLSSDTALPMHIDLPGVGLQFSVRYLSEAGRVRIRHGDPGELIVMAPSQDRHAIAVALRRFMTALALPALGAQLTALSHEIGLPFRRVQIRRQRTRWGSCSAKGAVSLNVCLLFQEQPVVRYLMVHELCHTRHMDHSVRFWTLVAQHEPAYRTLDRALLAGWQRVPWWMFG